MNNLTAMRGITINKVDRSKLQDIPESIPFGKYFTDHMLEADYENGEWKNVEIKPYQPLLLSPSAAVLHYGQAIFEGIKAYKGKDGNASIYRPYDNYRRFNISAERMQMPAVPEEIFIDGMAKLIDLDKNWIPAKEDHSLYIRPFMISTDEWIGVKPSDTYKFMILLSPTGPYYSAPMRIYVEDKYTRAAPGGTGYAKAAGNYAASLFPTAEARRKGYDQVLWTDANEHKYAEEIGTMNVFFIIDGKGVTPDLSTGTILDGVTRNSAITLMNDMGIAVEQKRVNMDEVAAAYRAGKVTEIFGTGTAATISLIRELTYKDTVMSFDESKWKVAPEIKRRMDAIKDGSAADIHGWMYKI